MIGICLAAMDSDDERKDFTELYEKYNQDVFRVSYKILQDVGSAEDAAQNVWLWAAKNYVRLKEIPTGEIQAYLVTAGKHTSIIFSAKSEELCLWMISYQCSRQIFAFYPRMRIVRFIG